MNKQLKKLDTTVLARMVYYPRTLFVVRRNMVGWKKVDAKKGSGYTCVSQTTKVIKLIIPKGALVVTGGPRGKARADVVIPCDDGYSIGFSGIPNHMNLKYQKGKKRRSMRRDRPAFDARTYEDCGAGIHFFWDRELAENYGS
jgi:hypothetical protein